MATEYTGEVVPVGGAQEYTGEVIPDTPKAKTLLRSLDPTNLAHGLYGLAEGGTQMITGMGSSAIGGLRGLNALVSGKGMDEATRRIEETQQKYTYQPKTAEGLAKGSSESLSDMNTQADLMKKNLKMNQPEDLEDAYVMHNLGRTGGRKFINATDDTPIKHVLSKEAIQGNEGLYGVKTVGEARAKIRAKLNEEQKSSIPLKDYKGE